LDVVHFRVKEAGCFALSDTSNQYSFLAIGNNEVLGSGAVNCNNPRVHGAEVLDENVLPSGSSLDVVAGDDRDSDDRWLKVDDGEPGHFRWSFVAMLEEYFGEHFCEPSLTKDISDSMAYGIC
jgi:hypothetical protein